MISLYAIEIATIKRIKHDMKVLKRNIVKMQNKIKKKLEEVDKPIDDIMDDLRL